mmetsp:Transcript_61141/g.182180  ORF Transcript_61141/g.182180 Transcript_61141/m.182180 type:complete len:208 (+) Transcript_61141:45-668(+)
MPTARTGHSSAPGGAPPPRSVSTCLLKRCGRATLLGRGMRLHRLPLCEWMVVVLLRPALVLEPVEDAWGILLLGLAISGKLRLQLAEESLQHLHSLCEVLLFSAAESNLEWQVGLLEFGRLHVAAALATDTHLAVARCRNRLCVHPVYSNHPRDEVEAHSLAPRHGEAEAATEAVRVLPARLRHRLGGTRGRLQRDSSRRTWRALGR